MNTTTSSAVPALQARLTAATDASVRAMHAEAGLALVIMATALREQDPAAAYFSVNHSDNGPWLTPSAVYTGQWELLTEDPAYAAEESCMSLYTDGGTPDTWGTYLVPIPDDEESAEDLAAAIVLPSDVTCILAGRKYLPVAFDLAKILTDADKLAPAEPEVMMPAIVFHPEASETWGTFFDQHPWAATFTLNNGTTVDALIVGSASRANDGFIGVTYLPVADTDTWEPTEGAEPTFLANDEFTKVVFH